MSFSRDIAIKDTVEIESDDSWAPTNQEAKDSRCGTVLGGRYRVSKLVGQGGTGDVYLAEHIQLGKPVAIKFLRDLYLADETSIARFVREAKAMSKLSHPHCVSVVDYGIDDWPFIVMDYVSGKPLDVEVHLEKIRPAKAIRITLQVLAGLAHAHERGIVHRDVKPENIIVHQATGTGEHACLLDFSLAKLADNSGISITGHIMGTPAFMSPEQARGEDVDARSDLYSVGLVIFETLTGRNPFECEEFAETLRMQCETEAPRLSDVAPGSPFSLELEAVVHKALAKLRDDRFGNAIEFIEALAAVPEAGDLSDVLGSKEQLQSLDESIGTMSMSTEEKQALPEQLDETAVEVETGVIVPASHGVFFGSRTFRAAFLVLILVSVWGFTSDELVATRANPPTGEIERRNDFVAASIDQAKKLVIAGQTDEAIEMLKKIRVVHPHAAEPLYLIANLFAEREWWSAAISRYRSVIELDSDYRNDPMLNRNAIRALANNKALGQAHALIVEQIGPPAISHLRNTLENASSLRIHRRAARALNELIEKQK